MSDNGDKKTKKWNWMAHMGAIIAAIAALITALSGLNESNEQDNTIKELYEKLTLEIVPKLSERIAVLEIQCAPPEMATKSECSSDEDCPDAFICKDGTCKTVPLRPKLPKFDKPKPVDWKFPDYKEFKMQAQAQEQRAMPHDIHPPPADEGS